MTALNHLVDDFIIAVRALRLIGQLAIPIQPKPAHGGQNRVRVLLFRALGVRVLDTQTEFTAVVTRKKPTEQSGAGARRYADARSGSARTG